MYKTLFLFSFITFFTTQSSPSCLTTKTTDAYSGTIIGHSTPQYAGCSCPCNKPRHNATVCPECGHTIVTSQFQGRSKAATLGSMVEQLSKK